MEQHSIEALLAQFRAAPMSRKAAMRVVLALDAAVDALVPAGNDVLAFRAGVAAAAPALGLVMAVAEMAEAGPVLALAAVDVTPEEYPRLSEAEYMVSLYNGATLPRVCIVETDGTLQRADVAIEEAVKQLSGLLAKA